MNRAASVRPSRSRFVSQAKHQRAPRLLQSFAGHSLLPFKTLAAVLLATNAPFNFHSFGLDRRLSSAQLRSDVSRGRFNNFVGACRSSLPCMRAQQRKIKNKLHLNWRLYGVEVPALSMTTIGSEYNAVLNVTAPLHQAVADRLHLDVEQLPIDSIQLIRKSLDTNVRGARRKRSLDGEKIITENDISWSHVVDVKLSRSQALHVKAKPGRIVPTPKPEHKPEAPQANDIRHIIVVGAGPCGLFAALKLARAGHKVTLCERGKPVEKRGRSIGALTQRGVIDSESNFCYGEGGAGTWSDGKLTTRIGRNSREVREVLETLVAFGAPQRILVDGKPHLGTDNLVRLLKRFRADLLSHGTSILWDTRVDALSVRNVNGQKQITGVLAGGKEIIADAVVLAAGHSARELYKELISYGAKLEPKDFAVGFRIEHPQVLINEAQYGDMSKHCLRRGTGPLPPASYRLAANTREDDHDSSGEKESSLAQERGIYSFCMCPGGQIVPTALDNSKLCVNGMSYSNRGSQWANSAIVATVGERFGDFDSQDEGDLPLELAGLAFQEAMEARASLMGGEVLRCPVQRVSDFLVGRPSEGQLPSSSYRLGVKAAPLHELYPPRITKALQDGIRKFASTMPGFDDENALLHGVETRTSAPVRILRNGISCEAANLHGLYPAGEGAGYAGGIVSAAVDGLHVADALLRQLVTRAKKDKEVSMPEQRDRS